LRKKTTIGKILFVAFWLCIAGGMLTLLLAAIRKRNHGHCAGYEIVLKGARNNFFIDRKDVEQMLVTYLGGSLTSMPVSSFRLFEIEKMLEQHTWIESAETYFDNHDVLHVTINEKEPVARIFTNTGQSFYIDSAGKRMPLSDKMSARVPVFTNFTGAKKLTPADSLVLYDVRRAARFILEDSFWMAQVAQVDLLPNRQMEMIPVVGNHVVRLGDGDNIAAKFRRLMIFYQQVLRKTGMNRYRLIDVQYAGQVVASRNPGTSGVDSAQLRRNVEKLLKESMDAQPDTATQRLQPLVQPAVDSVDGGDPSLPAENISNPEQINPAPVKTTLPSRPAAGKPDPKRPRAVMPARNRRNGQ